jgi:replicative DNA helicase
MSETLPANLDAERAVLGGILLDNHAYIEAAKSLVPEDFSIDSHRRIYRRMSGLLDFTRPCDLVTLSDELEVNKELKPCGGQAYIASLIDGLPDRPSIAEYVAIVKDKAVLRRVIRVCEIGIQRAQAQENSGIKLIGEIEAAVSKIGGAPRSQAKSLHELRLRKWAIYPTKRRFAKQESGREKPREARRPKWLADSREGFIDLFALCLFV